MAFYSRKFSYSVNPVSKKPEPDTCGPCYRYPPPYPAKHPIPAALVVSLGIAGAALLIISYLALRRCVSRRRSSPPPAYSNNREEFDHGLRGPVIDHPIWFIRTTGLPQPVIESIHRLIYKKGEGLIGTSDCSVCLSEFEDGESLRLLRKCGHAFHVACIDTWLGSHTNCPLCRSPVLAATGGQLSGVESSSSLLTDDGREGNGGIEIGEIGNRAMIGGEMEPMRRSVSLDISSAVDINVEAKKKAFSAKRSISISGPSILV